MRVLGREGDASGRWVPPTLVGVTPLGGRFGLSSTLNKSNTDARAFCAPPSFNRALDSDRCSSEFLLFPPQGAHLLNCGLVIWHVDDLPGGPVGANFCHTSNGIRLRSILPPFSLSEGTILEVQILT